MTGCPLLWLCQIAAAGARTAAQQCWSGGRTPVAPPHTQFCAEVSCPSQGRDPYGERVRLRDLGAPAAWAGDVAQPPRPGAPQMPHQPLNSLPLVRETAPA